MSIETAFTVAAEARIDADGRLIAADPRLAALNARAGGRLGAPLALPPVATVARLAHRLGILVSRTVVVGEADGDLELWVRAEPDADGTRLEVSGWRGTDLWAPPDESEARAADLVRSGADWLWEADASLTFRALPVEAGAEWGFDATALLGEPLTKLFKLSGDAEGELPLIDALALGRGFADQAALLRPSGRAVRLAAAPQLDGAGRFCGFLGATFAATPGDGVDVAAETTNAFSRRLDRALRLPLTRIIANADSIREGDEASPVYGDYAADIAAAGRHLLGLVDDLVDLQAIERPDFAPAAEPIDLADVARRASGLLQVRAGERRVRVDRPRAEDSQPATGEFRRALQVLVNLVGNAIRHSPEDCMVWIRLGREGDRAAVIVADQGRGIAPEDHERIFDKFARLEAGEATGSGLGLYIARRLARAMGGDVTVDSAPGQGARFVFTLPAGK